MLAFCTALQIPGEGKFVSETVHCEFSKNLISLSPYFYVCFGKDDGGCIEQELNNTAFFIVLSFNSLPYCAPLA